MNPYRLDIGEGSGWRNTSRRALASIDPAGLALVAYGGASPLHATALARGLGCRAVVVPPAPGVLSALGLLLAPARYEASRTVMAPAEDDLTDAWTALEGQARQELDRHDVAGKIAVSGLPTLDRHRRGSSVQLLRDPGAARAPG